MLLQGFLPLLLAVYDYWYKERRKPEDDSTFSHQASKPWMQRSLFDEVRYLLPTALFSGTYASIAALESFPRSTCICPTSTFEGYGVPFVQVLGLLIDAYVLVTLSNFFNDPEKRGAAPSIRAPVFLSFVLLVGLS